MYTKKIRNYELHILRCHSKLRVLADKIDNIAITDSHYQFNFGERSNVEQDLELNKMDSIIKDSPLSLDAKKEMDHLNRRIEFLEKDRSRLKKELTSLWKRQPERAERVKRGCLDIVANNCGPCPACGGYND